MFSKKEKKEKKEDSEEIEISYGLRKMPKNYKTGRFEVEKKTIISTSQEKKKSKPEKEGSVPGSEKEKSKNWIFFLLLLIILVLIIVFVGQRSGFSILKIFKPNYSDLSSLSSGDVSSGGKNIADIIKDEINLDDLNNIDLNEDLEDEFLDDFEIEEEDFFDLEEDEFLDDFIEELPPEEQEENEMPDLFYVYKDSDGDGLGDEEELILGSDPFNIDTDGDGHSDLVEVLNLYDPLSSGRLIENPNILRYNNQEFFYSVLHPLSWEKNALSDGSSLVFTIDQNSFIQILVEKNENNQDIKNWYADRFFNFIDQSDVVRRDAWHGVYSEDKMAFYISDNNLENIYTFLYSSITEKKNTYYNIFKMMINSFSLTEF